MNIQEVDEQELCRQIFLICWGHKLRLRLTNARVGLRLAVAVI